MFYSIMNLGAWTYPKKERKRNRRAQTAPSKPNPVLVRRPAKSLGPQLSAEKNPGENIVIGA
jgi:hypothetical protein